MYYDLDDHETTIPRPRVLRLVASHGASEAELFADLGDLDHYLRSAVLIWLGY